MYTCGLGGVFHLHDVDILMQWDLECIGLWRSQVLLMYCLKNVREDKHTIRTAITNSTLFLLKGFSTVIEK